MDFSPFLGRLLTQVIVGKRCWSELFWGFFLQCGTFIIWCDLITVQIKLLVMLHCWLQPLLPPPWPARALQPHSVNIQRCTIDHSVVSAVGFNDLPDNVLFTMFISCLVVFGLINCKLCLSCTIFTIVTLCAISCVHTYLYCFPLEHTVFLSLTLCPIVLPSFCKEGSTGCFTNRGDLWCEKTGTWTSSNPAALPVSPDVH